MIVMTLEAVAMSVSDTKPHGCNTVSHAQQVQSNKSTQQQSTQLQLATGERLHTASVITTLGLASAWDCAPSSIPALLRRRLFCRIPTGSITNHAPLLETLHPSDRRTQSFSTRNPQCERLHSDYLPHILQILSVAWMEHTKHPQESLT